MIKLEPTPATNRRSAACWSGSTHGTGQRPRTTPRFRRRSAALLRCVRHRIGRGSAWLPLTRRTNDEREALGYPREHPILVRSGDYRRSFTDPDHADHISEAGSSAADGRLRKAAPTPAAQSWNLARDAYRRARLPGWGAGENRG